MDNNEDNGTRRVIVIGGAGIGRHMAMALLAGLASQQVLIVEGPSQLDEPLDGLKRLDRLDIGDSIDVLALSRHEPMPELLAVAAPDDYEHRGKGRRRRDWESPYAGIGGGRKNGGDKRHLIRHHQRRGGR